MKDYLGPIESRMVEADISGYHIGDTSGYHILGTFCERMIEFLPSQYTEMNRPENCLEHCKKSVSR